ncbi:mercury(II) reductase [Corynebacterium diphtheriae]|uniref:mercury(II) reductase n=1 Tax=Corynebacterium TaxID=1716 RepID=UPI0002468DC7|nr:MULTISPECIES: mercury(II) reductase [Corynebacterium]AEX68741.1 mercuric reductase [Corynebacterium diphtheriae PW8]MCG7461168.1 mercury(II) reductase [Corynebacterium sp. ACRPF]MDK8677056.1 mercury(II) reductase [Corynebacterium tuberculostearicum]MDV2417285.1 mercury(II) reductase [Corynebacterium tuberculostearicum]OJI02162.1 mercury(II) reductase [Corynebacterium diphtheriae]
MPEAAPDFDLAVIGSGGGAFAAAIRATKLGNRVVMIERSTVGGTCVNTGCVPSKALLAAAEARHVAVDATGRFPGISTSAAPVDMGVLIDGKRSLVEGMRSDKYVDLAADYGWDLRQGTAVFAGTPEEPVLEITGPDGTRDSLTAAHYLVATGSTPWAPPVPGLDEVNYLTSTTAMELNEVPESLIVFGGGYVALEQAQLFARLGSKVTLLVRSRLASHEEPEASRALMGVFADEGIRVVRRAAVTSVRTDPAGAEVLVTATVAGGQEEFRAAKLLVATGRRAVTDGLNLDAVGVKTGDTGQILVESTLASSNPRIWAAGDVTGHREFVYVASAHGTLMVENAFNNAGREVDYRHLPRVTFTSPTLAAVGMTDKEANEAGIRCECRVLPLEYVPRALVNRDTRGFIKIVADADTGRIVGITAVGKEAGDLAAAGVYILEAGMTVDQVANLWCPYLTMAEGIKIAAQSFTTDVSKLSCCAS